MAIAYVDSSAISKLIHEEDGSEELDNYLAECVVVSSDLTLTEVVRGVRRVAEDTGADLGDLLEHTMVTMEHMTPINASTRIFAEAGALPGGYLRSLDAVHVATAAVLGDVDVFVTYDERQAAAARLAGFRTISPGA